MGILWMILLLTVGGGPERGPRVRVTPLGEVKLRDVRAPVAAVVDAAGDVYVLDQGVVEPVRSHTGSSTRLRKFDASGHLLQEFDLAGGEGISLALSGDRLFVGILTPTATEVAPFSLAGQRIGRVDLSGFVPLKILPAADGTLHVVGFDRSRVDASGHYLVRTLKGDGSMAAPSLPITSAEAARMAGRTDCFVSVNRSSLLHIASNGLVRDTSGGQFALDLKFSPPPSFVPADWSRSVRPYLAVYEDGKLLLSVGESISYRDAAGKAQRLVRDYFFVFDSKGKLLATSGPITASPTIRGEDGYYYILGYDEKGQVSLVKFHIEIPDRK